jgi:hypothetical protein
MQGSKTGVLIWQQGNIISRPILLVGVINAVINAGLIHSRSQTHEGSQFKVVAIKMK